MSSPTPAQIAQIQAILTANPIPTVSSSLDGNDSDKVIIINNILRLIIRMISALQNIGIAQAQHLNFTTQFEQAYTELQSQVPVFLKGDNNPVGPDNTDANNARNELNSSFNAFITQNLRNLAGLQDNTAKQEQSSLNQTNDAINQQTDMASTLIQQLTSLLSSILR